MTHRGAVTTVPHVGIRNTDLHDHAISAATAPRAAAAPANPAGSAGSRKLNASPRGCPRHHGGLLLRFRTGRV